MSNEISNIDRLLNSVGTETFVKYFYDFQKLNRSELLQTFDNNNENWTDNSKGQKVSNGFRIFKENREIEALEHILLKKKEGNVQNGKWVKATAKEIYTQFNINSSKTVENIYEIEKKVLVNFRIQQSRFRKELILHWEGCSITNCKNTKLLIASHIKPYSQSTEEEKYDVNNGLLLTPTFDKLFDLNLITFSEKGNILISRYLDNDDLNSLGITGNEKLNMNKITHSSLNYLAFQREKFEEAEKNGN